jgi:hypothetical protein
MELSSPMSQRARIISRGIAIVFLMFGMYLLYLILQWPFSRDIGGIIFGLVLTGMSVWVACLCFKIAKDFWSGPTLAGIKSLSVLMGIVGFYIVAVELHSWIIRSEDKSVVSWLEGIVLLGLIAGGIFYAGTKKISIQYFQISQAESGIEVIYRRKRYFAFIGFFVWAFFMEICIWCDNHYEILGHTENVVLPSWLQIIFPIIVLVVPVVLACSVYRRCVRKFCNMPSKQIY